MSITRRKPVSVKEVSIALFRAVQRMGVVGPADQVLTADQQTELTTQNADFSALVDEEANKKYLMVRSTNVKDAAKVLSKNFNNAYFQGYNNGITLLGVFDKESRVLYSLAENDGRVPSMNSEPDIIYWGGKIATGDAARVAAGGAPMSNPAAADVAVNLADFVTKNNTQGVKKTDFSTAQANTKAGMPAGILTVTTVWDAAELKYNGLSIEARRAKCREWGEVFESTELITINAVIKNSVTGALLAGAITTVLESGTEQTSNAAGEQTIETHIAFGVTLETELENFVTLQTPIEFETGVNEYNVIIGMVPV